MNGTDKAAGRDDLRSRLYSQYVSSGAFGPRPRSVQDLAPRLPYLRKLVRRHFPADRDSLILDLGCGNGALLHVAGLAGYRNMSGVDGSAEQVEVARSLGIENVAVGDLFACLQGRPAATLHTIITFDVIEHLSKSEIITLATEIRRVLAPNGRWLIHVPNGESPFAGRIRYGDLTHELAFTQRSLSAMLRAFGFVHIQCFEDVPTAHGPASAVRFVLWKTLRTILRLYIMIETGETGEDSIFSQNLLAVAFCPDGPLAKAKAAP